MILREAGNRVLNMFQTFWGVNDDVSLLTRLVDEKKKKMSEVGPLSGCFTPFNRKKNDIKKLNGSRWNRSRSVFDLGANCTFTLH